jgi:hypothetical protein
MSFTSLLVIACLVCVCAGTPSLSVDLVDPDMIEQIQQLPDWDVNELDEADRPMIHHFDCMSELIFGLTPFFPVHCPIFTDLCCSSRQGDDPSTAVAGAKTACAASNVARERVPR